VQKESVVSTKRLKGASWLSAWTAVASVDIRGAVRRAREECSVGAVGSRLVSVTDLILVLRDIGLSV